MDAVAMLIDTTPVQGPFRLSEELKRNPSGWMPWNYRETLERAGASLDSG